MLKTTVSKKTNQRNRSQGKNKRGRNQKAGKQKSRKNSPHLTNQRTHLRNEFEDLAHRFWAESSNSQALHAHFCSNIDPIYQSDKEPDVQQDEAFYLDRSKSRFLDQPDEELQVEGIKDVVELEGY